jgi:hypothetical protein
VDQQATRSPPIQSGATIYPSCLKGSQGVTPFLKVTDLERWIERIKFFKRNCLGVIFDVAGLKAVDNADELARESP